MARFSPVLADGRLRAQPAAARRAHLIGIAGAGMRALADVLHAQGWQVTGSDLVPLDQTFRAYTVARGHAADNVAADVDLVVYSDAIPQTNVELRHAYTMGARVVSYPQMLGRLMAGRCGVAIAGTHGKSTVTAMTAEVLVAAGLDPTVLGGGTPLGASSGGRCGRGPLLLAEACEYRANFLNLRPQVAVVLSVELDHFDCFKSQQELEATFARFVGQVPKGGHVLTHFDCPRARHLGRLSGANWQTFGFGAGADWRATNLEQRRGKYRFVISHRGRVVCPVELRVPGRHNVINALAATAVAACVGTPSHVIRAGLEHFAGLRRRLELIHCDGTLAVVDDYAHHPTEVTTSLATVREMFPGRRVWCVFQPHQASRTQCLLDEFARSLHNADKLIVAEIFRAREPQRQAREVAAADLAQRARARGVDVLGVHGVAEIEKRLRVSLQTGDVLVTLGAGDIGNIAHAIAQRFRTDRAAA